MYKASMVEKSDLIARLERKFQRKAKYEAERRHSRQLKNSLIDLRGVKLGIIREDLPTSQ